MRLSNNQLGVWNECQKRWYYNYVEGLKPQGGSKTWDKGLYTHELLHVLYHTLEAGYPVGSEFVAAAMQSRMESDIGTHKDQIEMIAVVMPLIRKYVANQHPVIDTDIREILGVELEFNVPFGDILLNGYIDLVYRDRWGKVVIRDHKSSEQINAWTQAKLTMNQQLLKYCLAMSIHFKEPVTKAEINFLNTHQYKDKRPNSDLFKIFKVDFNEKLVTGFGENLTAIHNQMVNGPHHRNFSSCTYCPYQGICSLELKGLSAELTKASMRKVDVAPVES